MKQYLGEFEEIVLLAIGLLGEEAYGVPVKEEIEKRTEKAVSVGALHTALQRLEEKGLVASHFGGTTTERGGRRKRYYKITQAGHAAIARSREIRESMWKLIPKTI
jgi:PadR family transcriptional regulator, regulatory protein PadR